ncbi:unnamed protein product [Adineta steineri]|uniref:G-protein coupled receptors family 1 profile domain-containing protein n=1 Tax=Adineta steineri TaxID=433720 RepID=A0A815UVC8_9BILA|nr:unnamed protein product [Adineta steineri]CAF1652545.1 unnamed protein product [Adineta steineri]
MSTDILKLATQYSLYSGCISFTFGVIGNILNILVFTQLKLFRDNRCAFYIIVESINNFIYQFITITVTILTLIYGNDATGRSLGWCKFRYMLGQTFALTSYYTVCLTAIDQFFSTNHQFRLRQMCTIKLARYVIIISICIWIAHSILSGWFFDIQESLGCVISNPIWQQYISSFFYPVLAGLLPITIVLLFSLLAFHNVRRIVRRQIPIVRRRLDQQLTAMVLMRAVIAACFILPYTIYRIYIIKFPVSQNQSMEYAIVRLIQAVFLSLINIHFSASFYIFLILSSRFRRQVKFLLVKKYWQRLKYLCHLSNNQINPENAEAFGADMELA